MKLSALPDRRVRFKRGLAACATFLLAGSCATTPGAGIAVARAAPGEVADAVVKLVAKSPVPVYLPTRLPDRVRGTGIERILHEVTDTGYTVSYYYSQDPSNVSFAGLVSGSAIVGESPPGSADVRLHSGAHAHFSPVSCGGSCAPANLWWRTGGAEYHLQLKLPGDLGEDAQRAAIVEMANSMVLQQ